MQETCGERQQLSSVSSYCCNMSTDHAKLFAWGTGAFTHNKEGVHDCGDYNSPAWDTAFFVSSGGSWNTDYGHFFLSWYSGLLLQHAGRVLAAASESLSRDGRAKRVTKVMKVCLLDSPSGRHTSKFASQTYCILR